MPWAIIWVITLPRTKMYRSRRIISFQRKLFYFLRKLFLVGSRNFLGKISGVTKFFRPFCGVTKFFGILKKITRPHRLFVYDRSLREGAKFMGYPGRVLKQGDKDFFYEKIWRARTFFLKKKGARTFFTKKYDGLRLFFVIKKGGQEVFEALFSQNPARVPHKLCTVPKGKYFG